MEIKEIIRRWIELDDEERQHKEEIKKIKQNKTNVSDQILQYMRSNGVDNFSMENIGNLSRSVRTSRPPIKRAQLRTQLLLHFSDQPQKVGEFLRQIEGIPDQSDNMSSGGTQKELLVRRLPRKK